MPRLAALTAAITSMTILGFAMGACSSTIDSAPSPPSPPACVESHLPPVSASTFCATFDDPIRPYFDACCGPTDKASSYFAGFDAGTAIAHCTAALAKSMAAGRVSIDRCEAKTCFDGLAHDAETISRNCSALKYPFDTGAFFQCWRALVGHQDVGQPCVGRYECRAGLRCKPVTNIVGVCAALGVLGEDCSFIGSDGYYIPDPPINGCADEGAHCDDNGKCFIVDAPQGGPCYSQYKLCNPGLWCDQDTCKPAPSSPSIEGGPCESSQDCALGLYCPLTALNLPAKCAPLLSAGQACAITAFAEDPCLG